MEKMPLEHYMHEKDGFKNYKLRFVAHIRGKGNKKMLKEAIRHIRYNLGVPEQFKIYLPLPEEEAASPLVEIEQFNCKYCQYTEFHDFGHLVKHV